MANLTVAPFDVVTVFITTFFPIQQSSFPPIDEIQMVLSVSDRQIDDPVTEHEINLNKN